jgi:hypothetical protein
MSQQEIESLFGDKPAETSATPAGGKDHTEIFAEGSKEQPTTVAGTLMQPFHGFNVGLSNVIGMPVDLVNWGMKKVGLPVSEKPFLGSDYVSERMADIGVTPEKFPAKNAAERALRAGGESVAYALAPQAGVEVAGMRAAGALPKRPPSGITVGETAEKVFGARKPGSLAATSENVLANLGGGAGAEFAMENVPDAWKPIAGMAGGVGGAGLTQLGIEGAKMLPKMGRAAFEYLQPIWNPEKAAARQFSGKTSSPLRALDIIENERQELIPGSRPTTFELTGDTGVGQMQRQGETQTPGPFLERRGEQAAARQETIQGIAPEGSSMEVPKLLGEQLAALEAREAQVIQQAEARARQAVEQMGGEGSPEEYGRLLRQYTQEAKDAANAARRSLYDAVDPEGSLNVVASGIRDTADRIAQEAAGDLAKPLEGELGAIVRAAGGADDVVRFTDLRSLDTRISDAMRTELKTNGETNTYRQLAQMKESVLDAINNAVDNQAKYEADAVRAGRMSEEDTLLERMRGLWKLTGGAEPAPRAAGLEPNLTPEAIANLEAAKGAHKEYVGTFREGTVGEALRPGQGKGQYKINFDAQVGPKFFRAGDTGFEAAQQFLKAAGDNPQAVETMKDYIVSRAFNEARDPKTGLIDPSKFDAWKKKHDSALRAFPDVADKLSSASKASDAAIEVAARSRASIESAQKSEIGKIVGAEDPETVSKMVGGIFGQKNAATTMRNLAQAASGNPDAKAGLQRAVADYVRQRFISTAEAGTSEANLINSASFQKFVRDNRRTLEQVLDKDQVNAMQALADDLNRSARSTTGSALPGRSTTAQDTSPMLAKGKSLWDSVVRGAGAVTAPILGGAGVGAAGGPLAGLAAFTTIVGAEIVGGMRAAGMQTVDQLITDALLNPDLARKLLLAAPTKAGPSSTRSTSEAIANTLITGVKQPAQGNAYEEGAAPPLTIRGPGNRSGRAAGGAVNLMALSKAAKKQVTQVTEPLLNESDDTVAHALEIAGKHI